MLFCQVQCYPFPKAQLPFQYRLTRNLKDSTCSSFNPLSSHLPYHSSFFRKSNFLGLATFISSPNSFQLFYLSSPINSLHFFLYFLITFKSHDVNCLLISIPHILTISTLTINVKKRWRHAATLYHTSPNGCFFCFITLCSYQYLLFCI